MSQELREADLDDNRDWFAEFRYAVEMGHKALEESDWAACRKWAELEAYAYERWRSG